MDLSVLDVLPVGSGMTPRQALSGAVSLARVADRSGYRRLWFAEHHGMANIASTSPELLIAHVAPATQRIRLGAGGVMLPNHTPLRVVEQYRTLEALHPGRIDLGIGRAAGTDPLTAHALRSAPGEKFGALLGEALAFDACEFPDEHPYARIEVTPGGIRLPPIWMLGSSGGSARLAGELGLGYAFAGHFSPSPPNAAIESYRKSFVASANFAEPRVILAVHALCAEKETEARELALAPLYALSQIEQGRTAPVFTPDEVKATGFRLEDANGTMAQLLVFGTPDQVRARLEALAAQTNADELMVMTLSHAAEPRLRSYELLARAFDLY
jgi:luciferase family oxidoreductase group 1